jgi:hypothetical protein
MEFKALNFCLVKQFKISLTGHIHNFIIELPYGAMLNISTYGSSYTGARWIQISEKYNRRVKYMECLTGYEIKLYR